MKSGWIEIDPKERDKRDNRRPYVVLRPKEGKIYFSIKLKREYLPDCTKIVVRYNAELRMLSFVNSKNGSGYRLNSKRTIAARNLFNIMDKQVKKRKAFFVRYNAEAKWLEVHLNKNDEGDMKWLKV